MWPRSRASIRSARPIGLLPPTPAPASSLPEVPARAAAAVAARAIVGLPPDENIYYSIDGGSAEGGEGVHGGADEARSGAVDAVEGSRQSLQQQSHHDRRRARVRPAVGDSRHGSEVSCQ